MNPLRKRVMRRLFVLGALIAVGALSMVVSGQVPAVPSKEAIATARIEKVNDGLYVITGSDARAANDALLTGGNTAVFITDVGVTLVDTKLPGFGPMILERIDRHRQAGEAHHQHAHAWGPHRRQRILRRLCRDHRSRKCQNEHDEDAGVQWPERAVPAEADIQG
jgi:hypothetical protein